MTVTLTERAADEVKKIIGEQNYPDDTLLRVGVTGGGCGGMSYGLRFDNNFDESADSKYDCHGITMVIDKKSTIYLEGTTVDFMEAIDKRGFVFNNPNATKSCGCGSSFQV